MGLPVKTFSTPYYRLKLFTFTALAALSCFFSSHATADIYKFVTIDGVETFTNTPVNKDARVVIKEGPATIAKKAKKNKAEKIHEVSLNEIVEKTVHASLQPCLLYTSPSPRD